MKHVIRIAKLQLKGGEARPGPALASLGLNIKQFCDEFNRTTMDKKNQIVPAVITVYSDKSFTFITKTSPTTFLIKKYAKLEKGSADQKKENKGTITEAQLIEIAKIKMPDLNTQNLDAAKKIVIGTMKQMGVKLSEQPSDVTETKENSKDATKK